MKTQKEQLIEYLKKKRDKYIMFTEEWSKYNNQINKIENESVNRNSKRTESSEKSV